MQEPKEIQIFHTILAKLQLERNIKLRYANTEFFNAIIKERERYEERRHEKNSMILGLYFVLRQEMQGVKAFIISTLKGF